MHASASRALVLTTALALAASARPARAQSTPATPPATPPAAQTARPAMNHGAMDHGAMDHGAMSHEGGWAAMDQFHMLLMKSWHPAKGTNDLAPTRANAAAMATKAEEWTKAPVPAKCGSATKATVARIATDARALAGLVAARAADAQVKESLGALHERFESVEKGCSSPSGGR